MQISLGFGLKFGLRFLWFRMGGYIGRIVKEYISSLKFTIKIWILELKYEKI
jgi:hypothetical protein